MDRSIPSFREIIEIEKLVWSEYKKGLKTKNDKRLFDPLFDNFKPYTMNLSFSNRPITIDSIIVGMNLYHYKTLVDLSNNNGEFPIGKDIVTYEIYKSCNKVLCDKTYDK